MNARSAPRSGKRQAGRRETSGAGRRLDRRSCIEFLGVLVFALLLGGFAASTWLQHRSVGGEEPASKLSSRGEASVPGLDRSRVRVEVRNGSGIVGAAGRMTEVLRARGFDVVDFGNADRFDHPRTFVVDRGGGAEAAREVAAALQGVPIDTPAPSDTSSYVDVAVVAGQDVEAVLARRAEPESRGWRRWWDRLRGR